MFEKEKEFEEMPEVGTEEETLIYKGALKDFSVIPNIFFRCGKNISNGALRLWGTLVMHAQGKGHCWPGLKCLGEETGLSQPFISSLLRELETKHLIKRTRRGLTKTNLYEIYDPVRKWLYRPIEKRKANPQAEVNTPLLQEVKTLSLQADEN